MKLVKYQGRLPVQIEGFPEDSERIKKETSLHLRPGQTIKLTDDEYAFIKANRDDVAKSLVILRDKLPEPKAEESQESAEQSEESKDEAPQEDQAAEDEHSE